MRLIEWIGQDAIFDNLMVQYNLALGNYREREIILLRLAARRRVYRVDNRVIRRMVKGNPDGLSKDYQWGPDSGSYVIPVTDNDARIILGCESKSQFRDVTGISPFGPASMMKLSGNVLLPKQGIELLDTEEFGSMKAFDRSFTSR